MLRQVFGAGQLEAWVLKDCVDSRGLSDMTRKEVYPSSRTEEVLNELGKTRWIHKAECGVHLLAKCGQPSDCAMSAFISRDSLVEFVVLTSGLTPVPAAIHNPIRQY